MKTADETTRKKGHEYSNGHGNTNGNVVGQAGQRRVNTVSKLFIPARGMKKIRCAHCEVVNLEKFVTYPHCAGCGALLTQEEAPRRAPLAWRRPLRPFLWATVVCIAAAAVVGAALMLRRPAAMGQLVAYGQTMRRVPIGGTLHLGLTIDTIAAARESNVLNTVSVRFDESFLQKFPIVAVEPPAFTRKRSGSGHYFIFESVPRETQISFAFKSLRAGRHHLYAKIYAAAQLPTEYQATVTVVPKPGSKALGKISLP